MTAGPVSRVQSEGVKDLGLDAAAGLVAAVVVVDRRIVERLA
jgi:hypothetical protein